MQYRFLPHINHPNDVKKLSEEDVKVLADECRHMILDIISKNGGHMGSNLGVVELTLAMLYTFDVTRDIIVWDGAYQTYTYKLLTGRRDRFNTLRTMGGVSGFGYRPESEFDPFSFGHVGTALAAAYGLATADHLQGRKRKIVTLVGDGALTSGVAFEALNNIGASKLDTVVILNDNGFSIARTVGALYNYFNDIRTSSLYTELKRDLKSVLDKLPLGQTAEKYFDDFKERVKRGAFPNIFSAFGFQYYGPVDGHDMKHLVKMLRSIAHMKGPVVLHVLTEKGRGHPDANKDHFGLHKPIEPKPKFPEGKIELPIEMPGRLNLSYTKKFVQIMLDAFAKDKRLVGITAAMPDGTGLYEVQKVFPERIFDVGISEQCAVAFAGGLAAAGMRPVCAIYATFFQRAYDQIFQEVCLQKMPVIFAIDRGGIAGEDGPTHHGNFDIAFMRTLPNTVLVAPKDGDEMEAMYRFALAQDAPIEIRIPRENLPDFSMYEFPKRPVDLGKGEILLEGKDGAILAYGVMVYYALRAAEMLEAQGIKVTVANARFAKPIDIELIRKLTDSHPFVLTAEDHSYLGGFGSAVLEAASMHGLDANKIRIKAIPDRFLDHANRWQILEILGLNEQGLCKAVEQLAKNPRTPSNQFFLDGTHPVFTRMRPVGVEARTNV